MSKRNPLAIHGNDIALLLLRVIPSIFMLQHGWSKLARWDTLLGTFADPLGVGSAPSFLLAVFAEFFCSLLLIAGVFTRQAALPLLITMLVAALVVHGGDPWGKKELPLLFATVYAVIALIGPGRFSVDGRGRLGT
jgi:putative oxidoreductase